MKKEQGRKMSEKNWNHQVLERGKEIFDNFEDCSTGVRTLLLIQRHKEGGEVNNTKLEKKITTTPEAYYDAILNFVDKQMNSDTPLRIYASVNERDIQKAIRKFKYEQLDADYYGQSEQEGFYLDIKNRFFGCLMQPAQQATSLFLFDVDNVEGIDVQAEALKIIPNEHIVKMYKTKNGWHIVTKPFNYTIYDFPTYIELKKDGLLLLSW